MMGWEFISNFLSSFHSRSEVFPQQEPEYMEHYFIFIIIPISKSKWITHIIPEASCQYCLSEQEKSNWSIAYCCLREGEIFISVQWFMPVRESSPLLIFLRSNPCVCCLVLWDIQYTEYEKLSSCLAINRYVSTKAENHFWNTPRLLCIARQHSKIDWSPF